MAMEFGILTLGDLLPDPVTGQAPTPTERLRRIVDSAVLAEQAGFDVFAVGEHHRGPYVISSPPVILSAILGRTERIRLSTGTTLLGVLDPVRVAEDYATLNRLSDRDIDLMIGAGIADSAYGMFGRDPADKQALIEENLRLLMRLWTDRDVVWTGPHRAPLLRHTLCPPPDVRAPTVWHAVSGNHDTARRAARFGGPLFIDNVRGSVARNALIAQCYRDAWAQERRHPSDAIVGAGCAMHVARSSGLAHKRARPYLLAGWSRADSSHSARSMHAQLARSPTAIGSPAEIIERVLEFADRYRHQRQLFAFDGGGVPWPVVREQLELLATDVLPVLRRELDSVSPSSRRAVR
jgi:alkanesulfonate monooxygenase SsuD/methylene tetrahydromethanopterin reductase-like flavin-dependent oxidoreductase (luciferase family)